MSVSRPTTGAWRPPDWTATWRSRPTMVRSRRRGLGGAAVVTETDNGRIHLTFTEAPGSVRAHTDNGSITVRLPDDGGRYAVDADSDNGDVDIDVGTDPDAERTVAARSDNGAIDIEYHTT